MAAKLNFLAIATFILLGLFFARAVQPTTDTYWHLAIGRQVWETKSIPNKDQFVYGPSDNHFTSTEWLAALIFYATVKYLGFGGLITLRVILGLATIYLLYQTVKLITQNISIQLLSCLIVGYTLAIRMFDRPENFSFFFLALVNYCCLYYYFKKKLPVTSYLLPATFLAWPNIHPLGALGLAIFGFYFLIHIRERGFKDKEFIKFALILAISTAAVLPEYRRFFYFLYASQVASFGITEFISLPERLVQTEGLDFLNSISLYTYIYLLLVALYLVSLIKILKQKDFAKSLVSLFYFGVLLLSIKLYRLIQPTVLVGLPTLLITWRWTQNNFEGRYFRRTSQIALAVVLLIIAQSIFTQDIVGSKERVSLTSFSASSDSPRSIVGATYRFWKPLFPQGSEKIIEAHLETKRLFTSNFWSSYFIWFDPKIKVFGDVMHEYRTKEDFAEEKTLETGEQGWQTLIEKHNIDTVVNSQFFVFYPNNTPVYTLSNWRLIYLDDVAIVYAREDVIKSFPVDLSAIHPELPGGLKFKPEEGKVALDQLQKLLEFNSQNGFARQQLVQYWLDHDLGKAKFLAEESRKLLPRDPLFSLHIAIIYERLNNCQLAKNFATETKRKSFSHPVIVNEIKRTVGRCL